MGKLTAKQVAGMKWCGTRERRFDGAGLFVDVGKRDITWRYRFRLDGVERVQTLGRVEHMNLSEAREVHRAARALVDAGILPPLRRRRAKRKETGAPPENREPETRNPVEQGAAPVPVDDETDRDDMLDQHVEVHTGTGIRLGRTLEADLEAIARLRGMESHSLVRLALRQFVEGAKKSCRDVPVQRSERDSLPPLEGRN